MMCVVEENCLLLPLVHMWDSRVETERREEERLLLTYSKENSMGWDKFEFVLKLLFIRESLRNILKSDDQGFSNNLNFQRLPNPDRIHIDILGWLKESAAGINSAESTQCILKIEATIFENSIQFKPLASSRNYESFFSFHCLHKQSNWLPYSCRSRKSSLFWITSSFPSFLLNSFWKLPLKIGR